jgi:hypothetical protein
MKKEPKKSRLYFFRLKTASPPARRQCRSLSLARDGSFLPPSGRFLNGGINKAGMGPDDPFLNVEKPNNPPFHGLRDVLQRTGQSPVSKVEERLRNEWAEGTGQKLFERSKFFWPGVFVSFLAGTCLHFTLGHRASLKVRVPVIKCKVFSPFPCFPWHFNAMACLSYLVDQIDWLAFAKTKRLFKEPLFSLVKLRR